MILRSRLIYNSLKEPRRAIMTNIYLQRLPVPHISPQRFPINTHMNQRSYSSRITEIIPQESKKSITFEEEKVEKVVIGGETEEFPGVWMNPPEKTIVYKDMFAVVQVGGKQYKVTPGDFIKVERIQEDVGISLHLNKVLLVGTKTNTAIGRPLVGGAKILVTVEQHPKAKKVIVFKKKRRKGYKKWKGHQQLYTVLYVDDILYEMPKEQLDGVVVHAE